MFLFLIVSKLDHPSIMRASLVLPRLTIIRAYLPEREEFLKTIRMPQIRYCSTWLVTKKKKTVIKAIVISN